MATALDLDKLKTWFADAEDASHESRGLSERDRDYLDGKQLSSEEIAELENRGQPVVVMNQIRRKINLMLGLELQRRTDPKGFAVQPSDQGGADAMTDALRFVVDNTNFDAIRSNVFENMLVEGFAGAEVIHAVRRGKIEVAINFYPWDRLFFDPHSRKRDFSDARYVGAVVWKDAEEFASSDEIEEMAAISASESSTSETFDDRPHNNAFLSRDRKRVRLILMWYRHKGDWHWARFIGSKILGGNKSQYVDENGDSVRAFVMQSLYVDRDNNRYGMVRDFISPQDEINKRRSKALWQSTMRQTMGEEGAVKSVTAMKEQMAKADGHIVTQPDKNFEMIPAGDQVNAHLQLLQEAKSEIADMGAKAVLAGQAGESTSGRAVLARQQGGLVEVTSHFAALGQFSRNIHRHVWWMVKQTWTEERWIRVTDDKRNTRFVGINQPFTVRDQLAELPQEQALAFARQEGLRPDDPRLAEVAGVRNKVEEIDIDVKIEDVPDTVSVQGETFDALINMAAIIPDAARGVFTELLIEVSPLRAETRDRLIAGIRGQQEQAAPLDQAEREAQVITAVAESVEAEQRAKGGGQAS